MSLTGLDVSAEMTQRVEHTNGAMQIQRAALSFVAHEDAGAGELAHAAFAAIAEVTPRPTVLAATARGLAREIALVTGRVDTLLAALPPRPVSSGPLVRPTR